MPQDTIFEADPKHDGLQITWEYVPDPDGAKWNCHVRRLTRGQHWKSVHVSSWTGIMLDMAESFAEEVHTAFFFGEARDLARVAGHLVRRAKAHARSHDIH